MKKIGMREGTMMKRIVLVAAGAALLGLASGAQAAPKTITLPKETSAFKKGPGVEAAEANCLVCHSPDYVYMQPPAKDKKAYWSATVTKMIKVFGASITPEDADKVTDYLVKNY